MGGSYGVNDVGPYYDTMELWKTGVLGFKVKPHDLKLKLFNRTPKKFRRANYAFHEEEEHVRTTESEFLTTRSIFRVREDMPCNIAFV